MKFKSEHTFEQRKAESDRIRDKYPDRIPVICEKIEKSKVQVMMNFSEHFKSHYFHNVFKIFIRILIKRNIWYPQI